LSPREDGTGKTGDACRRRGGDRKKVAMMRRLSTRTRLERLEARRQNQAPQAYREAFVVSGGIDGERHLVMDSDPAASRCYFHEDPGPGPQIADFGAFDLVLYVTQAEMDA
jgi:hypothetical protein